MTTEDFSPLGLHSGIQTADVNGDGALDLVVVADGAMPAGAYKGAAPPDGVSGHTLGPAQYLFGVKENPLEMADASPNVVAGTVKGDPDGVRYVGGDLGWFENDGFGHFRLRFVEDLSAGEARPTRLYGAKQIEATDLDEDGDPDFVVWCGDGYRNGVPPSEWGASRVTWFENRLPNGFFQQEIAVGKDPSVGAVADMDRDGNPDVVVADRAGGNPSLFWVKNRGGGFSPRFNRAEVQSVRINGNVVQEPGIHALRAMDLDRDGDVDLLMLRGSPLADLVALFQQPDGTFRQWTIDTNLPEGSALDARDLNGDRVPDIAVGGEPVKLLLSKGGVPRWAPAELAKIDSAPDVLSLRFADLNGDRRSDLLALFKTPLSETGSSSPYCVLVGAWIQPSRPGGWTFLPLNEGGPLDPGDGTVGGGLATGDFDQDGDLDVVRAHRDFPLVFFENAWNTHRLFKILSTVQQPGFTEKVISYVGTRPDGTPARQIGQGTSTR